MIAVFLAATRAQEGSKSVINKTGAGEPALSPLGFSLCRLDRRHGTSDGASVQNTRRCLVPLYPNLSVRCPAREPRRLRAGLPSTLDPENTGSIAGLLSLRAVPNFWLVLPAAAYFERSTASVWACCASLSIIALFGPCVKTYAVRPIGSPLCWPGGATLCRECTCVPERRLVRQSLTEHGEPATP